MNHSNHVPCILFGNFDHKIASFLVMVLCFGDHLILSRKGLHLFTPSIEKSHL
jgi:hypothetical protein